MVMFGPATLSSSNQRLVPVPLPFFSFTGWKGSFYGDLHAYGKQGVRFYSETKTVTSRWFDEDSVAGPNMTIQLK